MAELAPLGAMRYIFSGRQAMANPDVENRGDGEYHQGFRLPRMTRRRRGSLARMLLPHHKD